MFIRNLLAILMFTMSFFAVSAHAQLPQTSSGLNYLLTSQNADGTWQTNNALADSTAATASVLDTLKLLNQTATTPYTSGYAWLQGQSPSGVDYIAERIRSLILTDGSAGVLPPLVDPANGAWGGDDGYLVNPLDSVFALQALNAASYPDLSVSSTALAYLTNSQNTDGGWSLTINDDSSIYVTAIVTATLLQFPQTATIATAVNKGAAFLVSHQNIDGGFGAAPTGAPSSTTFETALTYIALVATGPGQAAAQQSALSYLASTQALDGSWNEDPYATALAVKALYLSENNPAPPPQAATTGSIMGVVIDAITKAPLAGVKAVLPGTPSYSATTAANGQFALSGIPSGSQQITLTATGYAPITITAAISAGTFINVGNIGLSANPISGTVMGIVWDADANAPYPGVTVQAIVNGNLFYTYQTTSAADGSYKLTGVTPGSVTVDTPTGPKPGYWDIPMTGTLAQGGILIYSPRMSKTHPPFANLNIQTDKGIYRKGDTVTLTANIQNNRSIGYPATLKLHVADPSGTSVYDTSLSVNLNAQAMSVQTASFVLPPAGQGGFYSVQAELDDANGAAICNAATNFGIAMSQITVAPNIPATLSAGTNTVTFALANKGGIPVSAGALAVTLKDPDGITLATSSQPFTLNQGESKTLTYPATFPALKPGAYTLTYQESDETTTGQQVAVALPNTVTIAPLFDKSSYLVRDTANLLVTLNNSGKFNLDSVTLSVAVPDAAYSMTRTLSLGSGQSQPQAFAFPLPVTITAGQHNTAITLTLPSGAILSQSAQLLVPDSSLSMTLVQTAYKAGDTISPVVANNGGEDTQIQYQLALYDVNNTQIAVANNTVTVAAGSTMPLSLVIPGGAADGAYNAVINYQDLRNGKAAIIPNLITVAGAKGSLQVQTDKQVYLSTDTITALSVVANGSSTPMQNDNLHLQVTTAAGSTKKKTWSKQVDWQQGVRNGVDTFGVNDWLIPDDDFSGSALDTDKWSSWGTVQEQNGSVLMNSSSVEAGISGNWLLTGDFDIQTDFSANNSCSSEGAEFVVSNSNYWFYVKNSTQNGRESGVSINGSSAGWTAIGGYQNSGKLRIVRSGLNISTYYWNGSGWSELLQNTNSDYGANATVTLHVWRGAGCSASCKFANFKVNSGRIATANETVDSVRLLPLNDNFDSGVINQDRWSLTAPANTNITEQNGRLYLQNAVANQNAVVTVTHQAAISGDASAQADFSLDIWGSQNMEKLGILFNLPTASYTVERVFDTSQNGTGNNYASDFNGPPFAPYVPTTDTTGTLMLGRSAGTMTASYLAPTGWQQLQQQGNINGTGNFQLQLWNDPGYPNPATKVSFGKFNITGAGKYTAKGTITEQLDAGSITTWGAITWTATTPAGTSVMFRTRSANNSSDLQNATWSNYITASGATIPSTPSRWLEIEVTLQTTDTTVTPLLNSLTVNYGNNPGDVIWQTDVPVNQLQGVTANLTNTIGTLGVIGKLYLQGTLSSSTGQVLASAQYPFYVEQGTVDLLFAPDKNIYKPGETVTISGQAINQSNVNATGLTLQVLGTGAGSGTLYSESFNLPANGSHTFSFTTTAGIDGIYGLHGLVTQNTSTLADISDQYVTSSAVLSASLSTPDTAGNDPFTLSLSLNNSGKVPATTTMQLADDSGQIIDNQTITIPAGETTLLQYTRQITGNSTYTATFTGDLAQTLTKTVTYASTTIITSINANVVADKISYNANDQVTISSSITDQGGGAAVNNLTAWIIVINSQGQAVYSTTGSLATLNQGQTITLNNYWNTAANPAGTYTINLIASDGGSNFTAAQTSITILGTTQSGTTLSAGLKGTLTPALNPVNSGINETLNYTITNLGNQDLSGMTVTAAVIDPSSQQVVWTFAKTVSLLQNSNVSDSVVVPTSPLKFQPYLAVLQVTPANAGQPTTLASAAFTVRDPIPPVLTVSTLPNNSHTNNSVLNITGTATDNQAVKGVTVNGVSVPLNPDGSFSATLQLVTGANTVTTVATDLAGNQTSDVRTIILDLTAPIGDLLIKTVAGGSIGDGGLATLANVGPNGVAVDKNGSTYIADSFNDRIRKIDALTGIITTVAGNGVSGYSGDGGLATAASLITPMAVAIDSYNNIYIADVNKVRRVDASTGVITTVAGSNFYSYGVAVDNAGNLYISDLLNNYIWRVDATTGVYAVVAGNGNQGFSGDGGPATSAILNNPTTLVFDSANNLYFIDSGNNCIRRVDATTGIITTVAGNGIQGYTGDGGFATAASISPNGITIDGVGNLYISVNAFVREVNLATGIINTIAGNGQGAYSGDGGAAIAAGIFPMGIAIDGAGNILIADENQHVRKITAANGIITNVAGIGPSLDIGDGGVATASGLYMPTAVAVDSSGNLFIADTQDNLIRRIDASSNVITTFAGNGISGYSGDGGAATSASFSNPTTVAIDGAGNLFVADQNNNCIRRIDAITHVVTTVAGNGTSGYSGDGGTAAASNLNWPVGVAIDSSGNLYIADSGNNCIRKVDAATQIITTVAGNGTEGYTGDGEPATTATLSYPSAVTVDGTGNLYIVDHGNNSIRRVDASTLVITTVAGNGTMGNSGDSGLAVNAYLTWPWGVAVDSNGNLYIADTGNSCIRKVDTTGVISTVVGNNIGTYNSTYGFSGDWGPPIAAYLNTPFGVTVDKYNNIYIADTYNNRIREAGHLFPVSIAPVTTPTTVNSQTITGNVEAGSTISVSVDTSAVAGPVSYPTPSTWSCTISSLATGINNITVTATTPTGNTAIGTAQIQLLNVSSQSDGLIYNRKLKQLTSHLIIANGDTISTGPVTVTKSGLSGGVTLRDVVGSYHNAPYLTVSSNGLLEGL